ncbi:MAG: MmgE/PrpD family protein [Pseudonocardiaceae bacterium]
MTINTSPETERLVVEFVREFGYVDMPPEVVDQALLCLVDLAGVAAAGSCTPMSRIARQYAVDECPAGARQSRLLFDGRTVSPTGAAFANAATVDSFDGHDGHALTKGHAGAAALPAALALGGEVTGHDLITAVVIGYEIATRAGIALHSSASDYHSSGSWNSIGCAAIGARLLGLDAVSTNHALGIAEYHGPRSPMMRCIEHPTMVKDGTSWGAPTGVGAALLAARGFTGAPAQLINTAQDLWIDLGQRWRILEQYLKPYPVCRWAHPAIRAVLDVMRAAQLHADAIEHIEVRTFAAASRLATRSPTSTEQAQYSLPFSVATAAAHGEVPATVLAAPTIADANVLRLSESMIVMTEPGYDQAFPAQRFADVTLVLRDGRILRSDTMSAQGSPEDPMSSEQIAAKYQDLTTPVVGAARSTKIKSAIEGLRTNEPIHVLHDSIFAET